jgi:hypothetical protein
MVVGVAKKGFQMPLLQGFRFGTVESLPAPQLPQKAQYIALRKKPAVQEGLSSRGG